MAEYWRTWVCATHAPLGALSWRTAPNATPGAEFLDITDLAFLDDLLGVVIVDGMETALELARMWEHILGLAKLEMNWTKSGALFMWGNRSARKKHKNLAAALTV